MTREKIRIQHRKSRAKAGNLAKLFGKSPDQQQDKSRNNERTYRVGSNARSDVEIYKKSSHSHQNCRKEAREHVNKGTKHVNVSFSVMVIVSFSVVIAYFGGEKEVESAPLKHKYWH